MQSFTSPYHRTILAALNRGGKHIYGGTVPAKVVAKRRAANKVARQSRRVNRGADMITFYQGRHRRPTVPSLTAEALVDLWAGDLFRHFEDPVPFGVRGPGRSIGDAAELARIDMRDRMAVAS